MSIFFVFFVLFFYDTKITQTHIKNECKFIADRQTLKEQKYTLGLAKVGAMFEHQHGMHSVIFFFFHTKIVFVSFFFVELRNCAMEN